jgi:sugar phosphate isomerase/epimerase
MNHDYSLAHLTVLTLDPPRLVDVAARAGYRYASLRITRVTDTEPLYDLARDRALMRETKARLAATGISVNDVELFRLDPTLEPEQFVRELEATAELGARHVIAQLPDPDEARATDRYGRLCDLARPLDITVDLEFPHWTEVGDLDAATRILRATERPNAGLLIDTLHFGRSHSDAGALDALPRDWFHFAHVCDAERTVPAELQSVLHTARDERLFPGEGTIDVRGILSHLPPGIPYSLEIPRAMLTRAVGAEQVAHLALAVTRTYFGE